MQTMIKLEKIVRKNILDLKPYSSARDEFSGKDGVFLDANENPFGSLNRYPDQNQKKLKRKLANLKEVEVENIFVGNGSDEVIDLAFRIFCNPTIDKVLSFEPSYGMYEVSAAINNIELIKVPLNNNFQIDLNKIEPFLKDENIKLIFICSPNNPTGNLILQRDIEYILNRFNGIVIIDEAYIDFAQSDSIIKLIKDYNNLIISQTFSKAWALAGARVGTAYSNKEIIGFFNKVKPPYNVSEINQEAAIEALNDTKTFNQTLGTLINEKKRMLKELQKLELVKKIYPSDANFLLIEVENGNSLYDELVNNKIIIRNRGKQLNNCLRITIGSPKENDELLRVLNDIK